MNNIKQRLRQYRLLDHESYEIFNDAYDRGIKYIVKGGLIRQPSAWLRSTAFNLIREENRKTQRQWQELPEKLIPLYLQKENSMDEQMMREELILLVQKDIKEMSPRLGEPMSLYSQGFEYPEISAQLNINEALVRQRVSRARRLLRAKHGQLIQILGV